MCGIAGIVDLGCDSAEVDLVELRRIRDAMAPRGPDGLGEWASPDRRVALGHRRLTVIGLNDDSNQPMTSADGTVVVVFNGEIYNYREIRQRLILAGRIFRSLQQGSFEKAGSGTPAGKLTWLRVIGN